MPKFEFETSVTSLSLVNADFLAKAAGLAKEDSYQLQRKLNNEYGFTKYKPFNNKDKDTQAFCAANEEMIILVFQGTESRRDWRTNLKIKLIPSEVGRIHCGFNEAIDSIWKELNQTVFNFRNNNQSIWIAGHSLGGALATLAADRLTEKSIEIKGLYTFGQPRVGDKLFAYSFDRKIRGRAFRFVHDEDIVPKVPTLLQGYKHIGNECYFDRDGKLYTRRIRWSKFVSRCASIAMRSSKQKSKMWAKNPGGIRDHGLAYYARRIRENLIKQRGGPRTLDEYMNY